MKKNDKQKKMLQLIADNPFINDMQIARTLGVSIQTVRLYRHELDIPELRLRVATMAQANMDSVRSLDRSELLGEILELKLNTAGKSVLKISENMLYGRGRIASGQFIFEHANTLAIALIDAAMAVTGVAKLRYKKPVFAGDIIVASAQVIRIRGNKYFVTVVTRRGEEEVFRAKFIIVSIDDFKGGFSVKIALDAMGGDHAPEEIVKGAIEAVNNKGVHVILVGMQDAIKEELKKYKYNEDLIEIVHASEVIGMDEHAATSFRKKKDASISVANKLVADKIADAVVAAGSTGAAMTASLLKIGRIKGVDRPAIALGLLSKKGIVVMLDGGANTDCSPEQLVQFAVMGEVYASVLMNKQKPTVALLNIGEEEVKGNLAVQKAHQLLKNTDLNFVGNCEGRDIPSGEFDVIVCDGFVGNVVLKLTEGLSKVLMDLMKEAFMSTFISKIGALLAMPALKALKKRMDYREIGGALLLGVNGVSIIAHGGSDARAIENAIYRAVQFSEAGMIDAVTKKIGASNAVAEESGDDN